MLALLVVVGVVAISRTGAVNDNVRQFGDRVVPSMKEIGSINALVFKYRADQFSYILADRRTRPELLRALDMDEAGVTSSVTLLRRTADVRDVAAFLQAWDAYVAATRARFIAAADRMDYTTALGALQAGPGAATYADVTKSLGPLNEDRPRPRCTPPTTPLRPSTRPARSSSCWSP